MIEKYFIGYGILGQQFFKVFSQKTKDVVPL